MPSTRMLKWKGPSGRRSKRKEDGHQLGEKVSRWTKRLQRTVKGGPKRTTAKRLEEQRGMVYGQAF